jgi:fibronectin-binding autotransporter adhesin
MLNRDLSAKSGYWLVALLSFGTMAGGAWAQVVTWTGGAANNNWSQAANWSTGSVPPSNTSTQIIFGGTTRLSPNLTSNWQVNSVTFATGAGAFNLASAGGSTLTVNSGGITNNSTSTQTISHALTLSAGQTWNAASGDLVMAGNINPNYQALTVTGTANTTISGAFTGTDTWSALTKNGSGTLTLSNNNTALRGAININAGTVVLTHGGALGTSTSGNTVAAGASLQLQGGITVTEDNFQVSGAGVGANGVLRNISGANTFNTRLVLAGDSAVVSAGGLLTLNQQVQLNGRTLTLDGAGTIVANKDLSNSGALIVAGSGDRTFNDNINVTTGLTVSGTGTVNFNQNVNAGSGSVTISSSDGTVNFNGAQVNASGGVTVGGAADVSLASTLNLGGGNLAISNAGATTITGAQVNVGNIAVSGSGDTDFLSVVNASSLTVSGEGTTTLGGSGSNSISSTTVSGGTLLLDKESGTALTGSITVTDGSLEFGGDNQTTAWTNLTLGDGAVLELNDTAQTLSTLTITGDTVLDFSGGGSALTIGSLLLTDDAVLTIINWSTAVDIFTANLDPGSSSLGQVIFEGSGGSAWDPIDGSITPGPVVPEPSTYGMILAAAALALWGWRRRRGPNSCLYASAGMCFGAPSESSTLHEHARKPFLHPTRR